MIHCPRCEVDVAPVIEMVALGQMVSRCATCGSRLDAEAPAVAAAPARTVPASSIDTIIASMRKRLSDVRAQIQDTRQLEAEAVRLERMIAAASPSTENERHEAMPSM